MSISEEDMKDIETAMEPILSSAVTGIVVAAIASEVKKLTTTNYQESDLTGPRTMRPTEDEVTVSKSEASASETEGSVAKDSVSAQEGSVKADETEALALTADATATEAGVQAIRTKAGASDIEVKELKIT